MGNVFVLLLGTSAVFFMLGMLFGVLLCWGVSTVTTTQPDAIAAIIRKTVTLTDKGEATIIAEIQKLIAESNRKAIELAETAIGPDIPMEGASKVKRYSDNEIVTSLNSLIAEQRRRLDALQQPPPVGEGDV